MGMALPEASRQSSPPATVREEPPQSEFNATGLSARGVGNGTGLSAEMGEEAEQHDDPLAATAPDENRGRRGFSRELLAGLSGFESHNDRGNGSARRPSVADPKRDGFPRGFSVVGSSTFGSRRMVINSDGITREARASSKRLQQHAADPETATTPPLDMDSSSRSMAIYFDSEQTDRGVMVDDSPVYGSVRTHLTPPEFGSFHMRGDDSDDASEGVASSRLDATVGALSFADPQGRMFTSKRKKASPAQTGDGAGGIKSQLHADIVLGADRANGGSKREGYISSRLFAKPLAGRDEFISSHSSPSPDVRAQENSFGGTVGSYEITFDDDAGDAPVWNNMYSRGEPPEPRQFHAAAVVGRRMVVVGGQTACGPSNDVQMLHLSKMTWSELGRARDFPNGQTGNLKTMPGQLPLCRGHSLISWGKTVLLVGGEMSPSSDKVEVWSFDLETEIWTKVNAKGEVPSARNGQSVTRAGSILIMFGGETPKGQKLNDLHILDLKSLMWLPLHTLGSGPSPRTKHCATMYDDRYLLVFGGASKSKPLSDLFALDFETMEWSKMKTKGIIPSPRCGHAGILIGDKWYIAGGETRGLGSIDTLMLDVCNLTWTGIAATTPNTAVANQGLSLVLVQRKEKTMLVAFGGKGSELSNQVHSLYIMPLDHVKTSSFSINCELRDGHANASTPSISGSALSCACVEVAKTHLTPLAEEQHGARNSAGNSPSTESSFDVNGPVSLRRRYGPAKSKFPIVRQPPAEILSRVLRETSAQECSPLQHLQPYKAPDAVPALDLEMRNKLAPITTRTTDPSSRKLLGNSASSGLRKGSMDSTLTSVIETSDDTSTNNNISKSLTTRTKSSHTNSELASTTESLYTTTQRHSWEGEECSDSQLLADLQDAMTMERRIHLINKYRQSFEMKLAAAVRKGEGAEGQLRAAVRGKEECERSLGVALKTRQHAEGKLAASLKAQAELRDRVALAERGMADSNGLCNVVHSENLRLEHDLAFLKAVLEDTQKELQSTREVLANERARSFHLQMEVFDLKKKLPPSTFAGETPNITSDTLSVPASEDVRSWNGCLSGGAEHQLPNQRT